MAITPRTGIGVDEIIEPIFDGEMGQRFRPTDTKLKGQVAITRLPSVATPAGQLAPIQPEAEGLAAGVTLESIYASLPTVVCQGLCAESCGPIACSQAEADRIEAAGGRPLEFTSGLTCGYLDPLERRCHVYALRPLICRVWGVAEDMSCPWGCEPTSAPVNRADVRRLIQLSVVIGGGLVVATKRQRYDQQP